MASRRHLVARLCAARRDAIATTMTTIETIATIAKVDEIDETLIESLKCPITSMIMRIPVIAKDGVTYEKQAILKWLSQLSSEGKPLTSPMTRKIITKVLRPNRLVGDIIANFAKKYGDRITSEMYPVSEYGQKSKQKHNVIAIDISSDEYLIRLIKKTHTILTFVDKNTFLDDNCIRWRVIGISIIANNDISLDIIRV